MIKRHLTRHLPSACPTVVISSFPKLDSNEFNDYLHNTPIHFVMAHDGSGRESNVAPDDVEDLSELQRSENIAKKSLRSVIFWFNTHQYNVALINRIEFRDSKVFTMIVESFTAPSELKLAIAADLATREKAAKKLQDVQDAKESKGPASAFSPAQFDKLAKAFADEDMSESYLLAIHGISTSLTHGADIFLASAFALHSVILQHVPLSQRRFGLVTFGADFDEEVDKYISNISSVFNAAVQDTRWNELMDKEEIETDAIDLIDGRLFRVVIQAMCDESFPKSIPKTSQEDWNTVCGLVKELCGKELSLEGSEEPESSETTTTKSDFEPVAENLAVLGFSNPVFDKHLECIHVEADASLPARLGALKIYRETSHWHNHKKPLNPKVAPVAKVSKWRYVLFRESTGT